VSYKNWWIVIFTLFSIPLVLFGWAVNLNLAWTYYFMGVLISSSVVPIGLSITWARASWQGTRGSLLNKFLSLCTEKFVPSQRCHFAQFAPTGKKLALEAGY
jgi:hypothetical protein